MNRRVKKLSGIYMTMGTLAVALFVPGFGGVTAVVQEDMSAITEEKTTAKAATKKVLANQSKGNPDWKVKLKKCTHPKKLNYGYGFDVEGIVHSTEKLKSVTAKIVKKNGKVIYSKKIKSNGKKKVDLNKVDATLKFSNLKKGNYVYKVSATDMEGNSKEIVDDSFTVKKCEWIVPVRNPRWGDGWHCDCSTHRGRHYGWDIRGGGLAIHATSSGTVVYAKYHGGSSLGSFGNLVVIYHGDGIYSYYAHCASLKVEAGDKVSGGDVIGITGSTGMSYGAHLHFELRKGPAFGGGYNSIKLVDKYTYVQFNPSKRIER